MVGGYHNKRNCIRKVAAFGRLRTFFYLQVNQQPLFVISPLSFEGLALREARSPWLETGEAETNDAVAVCQEPASVLKRPLEKREVMRES